MGTFSSKEQLVVGELNIAIVVSRFNEKITSALLDGALNEFDRAGLSSDKIKVFYVPGALELAVVVKSCAERNVDAVVCLGAVIKGETPHFEYVSNTCALAIADVATSTGVPCIFGVLTVNSESQAQDRIGGSQGHKGEEAAASALETISTLRNVEKVLSERSKSTGFMA